MREHLVYVLYIKCLLKNNLNPKMTGQVTHGKVSVNVLLVTIGIEKQLARGTISPPSYLITNMSQIEKYSFFIHIIVKR
jgi:hypothetical protein